MNEMNPLEAQLRSWTPRRASAKLKQRLFGPPSTRPRPAQSFAWLAPVAACLLFTGMVMHQRSGAFSDVIAPDEMVGATLSNQSFAAYLPGSFQGPVNRLDTFEWTNRDAYTSSMQPPLPVGTGKRDGIWTK